MSDPVTPNMLLPLPVPGLDTGPGWATALNNALGLIDAHDHATIGVPLSTASLDINATLPLHGNAVEGVSSVVFTPQTPTVFPDPTLSLGTDGTDLYYAGVASQVRLTHLGAPAAPTVLFSPTANPSATLLITNTVISSSNPWTLYTVNPSSGGFQVTLPSASIEGKIIIIKDTGNATSILAVTIVAGSGHTIDGGGTSPRIQSAFAVYRFIADGSNWFVW